MNHMSAQLQRNVFPEKISEHLDVKSAPSLSLNQFLLVI